MYKYQSDHINTQLKFELYKDVDTKLGSPRYEDDQSLLDLHNVFTYLILRLFNERETYYDDYIGNTNVHLLAQVLDGIDLYEFQKLIEQDCARDLHNELTSKLG